MMKFSFLGTGFIFPTHLEAIREAEGQIVGYDTDEDCVVVLTPNYLHFPMIISEVRKGKIVLCEKPLVIKYSHLQTLARYSQVYTVLQLRHHHLISKLREQIKDKNEVNIDISVYRPPEYYQKWKGNREQSGGILFNLGIHYFDLLICLMGKPKYFGIDFYTERTISGWLKSDRYECKWRLSTEEEVDKQRRVFEINGQRFDFSNKDNLAYENLHKYVYQDLINGKGVRASDQNEVIKLIEKIYQLLLKYTYIVDISDMDKALERLEKRTRYDIRKCEQDIYTADDIYRFDELHKITRPNRKINTRYIVDLYNSLKPNCQIYFTKTAGALISWDKDRAYYLLGARDKRVNDKSSAAILWQAMKDMNKMGLKELDLCGANKPTISLFKRGFGGKLIKQTREYIPQF